MIDLADDEIRRRFAQLGDDFGVSSAQVLDAATAIAEAIIVERGECGRRGTSTVPSRRCGPATARSGKAD